MFPSLCLRPIRRSNGSGLVRASAGEAGCRAGPLITRTVPRRGPATVALAVVALVTGTALAHAQAPVTVSWPPAAGHCDFPRNWRAHLHYLARHAECWRHRWSGNRRCWGEAAPMAAAGRATLSTRCLASPGATLRSTMRRPWASIRRHWRQPASSRVDVRTSPAPATVAGAFQMTAPRLIRASMPRYSRIRA